MTCVFVKVRVCVSLAERDVKCDRNASEVAKHDDDMSVFLGEGKTRTAPPLYQHSFPALSSSFDSLGRNSTSRPADGSLSSPNHSSALFSSGWVAFTVKTLPYMTSCCFTRGVTITQPSGCRRICLTTSPISHLGSAPPLSRTQFSFFFFVCLFLLILS